MISSAVAPCRKAGAGMAADAIGTLRHVRDSHRDQLLRFYRHRTFSEHASIEGPERLGRPGCQTISLLGQFRRGLRKDRYMS